MVSFIKISENPTTIPFGGELPQFGQPEVFGFGPLGGGPEMDDHLVFPNIDFTIGAENGSVGIADSELRFTIDAHDGSGITEIVIAESGDYTLARSTPQPPPAPFVAASIVAWARVVEIDGTPLATPFVLPVTGAVEVEQEYDLPEGERFDVSSWSLTASIDVAEGLRAHDKDGEATRIEFWMDNTLTAITEPPSSAAFIAKKDVTITVTSTPEPGTALLLVTAGVIGLATTRRRRKP
jgi:hypothetical protein